MEYVLPSAAIFAIGMAMSVLWYFMITGSTPSTAAHTQPIPIMEHPRQVLVECDCYKDSVCPQGRVSAENPHKCKVWKTVYEGSINSKGQVV